MDYHDFIPDDWWEEHDGQRLVLDPKKVAAEMKRWHEREAELLGAVAGERHLREQLGDALAAARGS